VSDFASLFFHHHLGISASRAFGVIEEDLISVDEIINWKLSNGAGTLAMRRRYLIDEHSNYLSLFNQ
jgi:hypothetical protein